MTELELCQQNVKACEEEIGKGIIGQKEIIRQVMLALLAGGNVLLEGMPGLGKTMLVRTISEVFQLSFKRIYELQKGTVEEMIRRCEERK